MANSVLCLKCGKWTHERCTKVNWVTPRLRRDVVCGRCKQVDDGLVEPVEELCEEVKTLRCFCYLGDRVNASGAGGQEEVRTTKEDVEDASGEGEQECWFGEGGYLESREMESGIIGNRINPIKIGLID